MSNRQGRLRRLRELLRKSENRTCADCGAHDPKYASANIGVFICFKCCGVHRSLGSHISKVMSITLDDWSEEEVESMVEIGGNSSANSIYEAHLPEGFSKPGPNASHEERLNFIRSKYERQEFVKPSLRIASISSGGSSFFSTISERTLGISARTLGSFRRTDTMTMEEPDECLGILKVRVIKGIDLAIRDMLTSDPYVILAIGQQKVQTTVIKSNLNPVWDEVLTLSVPHDHGALKLQVYDHDLFSSDDIMGEADIDIHPLVTTAMSLGDPSSLQDMQVGKWLKSDDNALIEDSIINVNEGAYKQEMSIKLQNVECGKIYLELEWVSLDD